MFKKFEETPNGDKIDLMQPRLKVRTAELLLLLLVVVVVVVVVALLRGGLLLLLLTPAPFLPQFIGFNCLALAMAAYKCNTLGLLPTSVSDWTTFEVPPSTVEAASGSIL